MEMAKFGRDRDPDPRRTQNVRPSLSQDRLGGTPPHVRARDRRCATGRCAPSGPAGQARDWDRFRSLFVPHARLIPTGTRPDGTRTIRALTVDEYARNIGPQLERGGFFERELGRKVERYGDVVHLMSAYDSKRTLADPAPFARGVNSFQLWHDGTRWYVVTIYWQAETSENPIPAEWITKP